MRMVSGGKRRASSLAATATSRQLSSTTTPMSTHRERDAIPPDGTTFQSRAVNRHGIRALTQFW